VTFHYSRGAQSFGRNRLKGAAVYACRVFSVMPFENEHRFPIAGEE